MPDEKQATALNDLSPAALAAAMRGGTAGWGTYGNIDQVRYIEPAADKRSRCRCGCHGSTTHIGKANGVGLAWGCELAMRRWVKDPMSFSRSVRAVIKKEGEGPRTTADRAYLEWKRARGVAHAG